MEKKAGSRRKLLKGNFILLVVSSFLFSMSGYMVVPLLPIYLGEMGALETEVGFIIGLFPLAAVFTRIPIGRYIDRHGRRGILILGIVTQAASPFLYTLCTDNPQFMVVRLLNGFGFAAFTVTATTIVVDTSPKNRLGETMGIFAISLLMSHSLGPSVAGFLLGGLGYFSTFYIIGLVALSATLTAIRIKIPQPRQQDGGSDGFATVLRNRNLITACIAIALIMVPHGLIIGFFPLYAVHQGMGPEAVGLFFTVFSFSMGGIRPFTGSLSDRLGRVPVLIPFAILSAAGVASFAFLEGITGFLISGAIFGVGLGAAHSVLSALSVDTIKPSMRGQAVGVYGTTIELGISAGAIGMGPIVLCSGYSTSFILASIIILIGISAFLVVRAVWKKPEVVYT